MFRRQRLIRKNVLIYLTLAVVIVIVDYRSTGCSRAR